MAVLRADEIEKLFKKPGEKRYDYFIKTVADTEAVYGLADEEGWALLGDDSDTDILPLFPAQEIAEAFKKRAGFEEETIEPLDVNELLEWLDDMGETNVMIAVFPNPELNGAVVDPEHLKEDLLKELDKYDEEGKKIK